MTLNLTLDFRDHVFHVGAADNETAAWCRENALTLELAGESAWRKAPTKIRLDVDDDVVAVAALLKSEVEFMAMLPVTIEASITVDEVVSVRKTRRVS